MKAYLWPTVAVSMLLAGCSTTGTPPPEPIIRTVEIKVPVPVPCKALEKLGPEPAYPDTDSALRAAPNIFVQAKLLMAGRKLRILRSIAVAQALAECGKEAPAQ